MKTILVTGGAGFVGSHLALRYKAAHPESRVLAFDNLKRRGSELNLPRLKAGGVEFMHGDIRSPQDLLAAGKFDLMLECSAEPSVLAGYGESPAYLLETNLVGTIHCLEAVRLNGAGIIFLSTSRVYPMETIGKLAYGESDSRFVLAPGQTVAGTGPKGFSEAFPLEGVRSLYGTTKLASEMLLREYVHAYGIPGVINRCGVLTGPWQMGKVDQGVVVLWVARHFWKGKLSYIGYGGTGKQVRDVLSVEDLFPLIDHQAGRLDQFRGEVFNVGGGLETSLSLSELTAMCRQATGNSIDIASVPENRNADIPYYITDNTKVTTATGWKPSIAPYTIIENIARWIRDNEDSLKPILS
ncbi:MAG: tyvulose epimerase [Fibrobacteres bacterium]|nr:tyvulose epimerase [Fibrobacterota bacterium]